MMTMIAVVGLPEHEQQQTLSLFLSLSLSLGQSMSETAKQHRKGPFHLPIPISVVDFLHCRSSTVIIID